MTMNSPEPFDIGKPSRILAKYISEVEEVTGLPASISPFADATAEDEFKAVLNLGPSINLIDIEYRPPLPLGHKTIEKLIAHEMTHALLIYGKKYPLVAAEKKVPTRLVQLAANVQNFIDDVIVDKMISERGFPTTTPELLHSYFSNCLLLELAESLGQVFDPYQDDPVGTEIRFVGDYIYAWALPRYVALEPQAQDIYGRFRRLFRGLMKVEFAKCERVCELILQNDIFSEPGRTNVVLGALDLWEWDDQIYLAPVEIS